jgi:AraC-like DNA-binding protein
MNVSAEKWSYRDFPKQRQRDAYQDYLVRSDVHWEIDWVDGNHLLSSSVHRHPNLFSFFRVEAAEASSDLNLVSRGAFNSPRKSSLGNIADFFALTLMERGCLQSRVGSDEVRLEGGAITLWDPSQPVSYEFEGHVRHLTLLVRRDICTSIMPGIDRMASASILPNDGMALLLGNHLRTMHAVLPRISDREHSGLMHATIELFAATVRSRSRFEGCSSNGLSLIRQAEDYIERNLCDPELTIAAIAATTGISQSHLHRLFRSVGITVGNYIRSRRLSKSKEALRKQGQRMNLTEIAQHFGFYDSSHFSRTFRAEYGVAPSVFRKRADKPRDQH